MARAEDVDWASHDQVRIQMADLFHEWRTTWDELQQQRVGGTAGQRDLIARLVELEQTIERVLPTRTQPPS